MGGVVNGPTLRCIVSRSVTEALRYRSWFVDSHDLALLSLGPITIGRDNDLVAKSLRCHGWS